MEEEKKDQNKKVEKEKVEKKEDCIIDPVQHELD